MENGEWKIENWEWRIENIKTRNEKPRRGGMFIEKTEPPLSKTPEVWNVLK